MAPRTVDRRGSAGTSRERAEELKARARAIGASSGLDDDPSIPTPTVGRLDPSTGNPASITLAFASGSAGLPGGSAPRVTRTRTVLESVAPVLGLEAGQPPEFVPDPLVMVTSSGASAVTAVQRYRGIPVFEASSTVVFDRNDEPVLITGHTVSIVERVEPGTTLSATEAASRAAGLVGADREPDVDPFGQSVTPPPIDLEGFEPTVVASFEDPDRLSVLEPGPFTDPIPVSLVWIPLSHGPVRLAWQVVLGLPGRTATFRVLVDAGDGEILYAADLARAVRARALVHLRDGKGDRTEELMPLPVSSYGVLPPGPVRPGFPDDWVAADVTAGNAAVAHEGTGDRPARADRTANGEVVFDAAGGTEQAVVNAFFFVSAMHDFFYLMGFDEDVRNFQETNPPGAAGLGGDPVDVAVHPRPIDKTASMSFAPPDGRGPTLSLGTVTTGHGERHSALDLSVVAHEYTHGVTHRLVGQGSGSTLEAAMSRGLDEGWADYIACFMTGGAVVGAWLVDDAAGIRRLRYDETFPTGTDNYGSLGSGRYTSAHAIGEIWCGILRAVERSLGGPVTAQLVVDALKLTPANPGFIEARDALLTAAVHTEEASTALADAPGTGAGILAALRAVFATFGLGPGADGDAYLRGPVTPDFTRPTDQGHDGDALPVTTSPGGNGSADDPRRLTVEIVLPDTVRPVEFVTALREWIRTWRADAVPTVAEDRNYCNFIDSW